MQDHQMRILTREEFFLDSPTEREPPADYFRASPGIRNHG
jgi:hypothetical protein